MYKVCNYERNIVMRIIKRNILLFPIIGVIYYFRGERKRSVRQRGRERDRESEREREREHLV